MFSASIVALVTPFNQHNQIDFEKVTQLIEWHISAGTSAIVVAGTTGESPTLSDKEKLALAAHSVAVADKRIQIILGNGCNNTAAMLALTEKANALALDGYLTVTPYYNKPTQQGLFQHFKALNEMSAHQIILYNVPGRTQCDLHNDTILKLAELKHISALKDATADLSRLAYLRKHLAADFSLLSGDDATALAFCMAGGHGVISVTANIVPALMANMMQKVAEKQFQEALDLNAKVEALHRDLFLEPNPIAVKWALMKMGKLNNAQLRLPLTELSSNAQQQLQQTLTSCAVLQ